MTICVQKQDSIGSSVTAISLHVRKLWKAKAITDQDRALILAHLYHIERCKALEATIESLQNEVDQLETEVERKG